MTGAQAVQNEKRKAFETFRFCIFTFTFCLTFLRRGIFCIFCLSRSSTVRSV